MTALFEKLPGSRRAAAGLEHRIWRALPRLLWWGTLAPLAVALLHAGLNALGWVTLKDATLELEFYLLIGFVVWHWTMVLTVGIGCFIVRVMKGPAYVADGYVMPIPPEDDTPPPV